MRNVYRRRANRGRRRKTRPRTSMWSWLILAIGIPVLIAGGITAYRKAQKQSLIDNNTFCEKGNLPQVTMVLIDATDPLDDVQKERAIAALLKDAEHAPKRARIDIYSARPESKQLITPLFSKCNPGAETNPFISDAKAAKKRFSNGYIKILESAFNEAVGKPSARTSPILESIRAASVRSFSRIPDSTRRQIIIISDMLQNSTVVSHYRGIGSFDVFRASKGWPKVIVDLGGADVRIFYITRYQARNIQGRQHLSWWEKYFEAVNGELSEVESF